MPPTLIFIFLINILYIMLGLLNKEKGIETPFILYTNKWIYYRKFKDLMSRVSKKSQELFILFRVKENFKLSQRQGCSAN